MILLYFKVIPQIIFDYDFFEVIGDRYLKLSSRMFVQCPYTEQDVGKISPRCFKPYQLEDLIDFDPSYFRSSLENSFPELQERVNFINKFYQCLLCHQLPHKVRKLVVVGDSDSGKTSWANILFGLIPENKTAVLTKEKVFGHSMIGDDTELLFVDEWNADMMSSDMLKNLLQGGYFPQSVKYKNPTMQSMNAGVYMTCNILPSFGEEDDNVKRRLSIYQTKSLTGKVIEAPRWMKDHAFQCLVWMVNTLNRNKDLIYPDERFYELDEKESANAIIRINVPTQEMERIKNVTLDSSSSSKESDSKYELILGSY